MPDKKRLDPESEAALEAVKMEKQPEELKRKEQEIKEKAIAHLYEMAGKIKTTNFVRAQSEFFKLIMLKQVKESKEYRDRFGMSWEEFCEHVGVDRRRIDEKLVDLKPFKTEFLATFAAFLGIDFSKIKYLGEAITANVATFSDNAIVYQGETIPLTPEHKDDIQALLEKLEESYKAQIEEQKAVIRTKDRLIEAKEDVIGKQEKEIRRLEKSVPMSDLTPEEQEAVDLLFKVQSDFLQAMTTIKQKIDYVKAPRIALRQLYFLYIFIAKVMMDERLALFDVWREAEEVPWEITEAELPPTGALIDNMPLTYGKGMGKKVEERIEKRLKGEA